MITEIGHYALVLALALAIVQSTAPLWGVWRGDAALMAAADRPPMARAALTVLAVVSRRTDPS